MERRGQGRPFCYVKSAAVQEVTVAIARPMERTTRGLPWRGFPFPRAASP